MARAPGEAVMTELDTAADAATSPLSLTVSYSPEDGVQGRIVLRVVGGVDLSSAGTLDEQLHQVVAAAGADAVVVDLEGVSLLTARAVDVLVSAAESARTRGVRFQVLATRQRVVRVLELTDTAELVGLRTSPVLGPSPFSR